MKLKALAMLTLCLFFSQAVFGACTVKNRTAEQYVNCVIAEADCVFAVKQDARKTKTDKRKKQVKQKTG